MKKLFLCGLMAVAALTMQAQDVQLHYDFGRNLYADQEAGRQKVTLTLEQFKADKWGAWYYFVDVDFSRKFTEHFSVGTEWELSNNFIYNTYDDKSFFVNPTLAVKWNF